MGFLDMKSIIVGNVLMDMLCTGMLLMLWYQHRNRYKGLDFLSLDFALQTIAMLLILLRVFSNSPFMIISSSIFMFGGIIAGLEGSRRFIGVKGRHFPNLIIVILFIPVQYYLIITNASVESRSLLVSAVLFILLAQNSLLLVRGVKSPAREYTLPAGIMFGLYCLLSLIRIIKYFLFPDFQDEYLTGRLFEEIILLTYQAFFVMLAMSLMHMVNKRLTIDIRLQEEKFAKAFQSSPYAILLTRLNDGTIIEVNHGFSMISGYDPDEVIGRTTPELHFWQHAGDRKTVVDELTSQGIINGQELKFFHKNGNPRTGLLYANTMCINGEDIIVSSISDITERKKMEENISQLLADKEVLLREIHHRVKNNMMTISSLLSLQAQNPGNNNAPVLLLDASNRIKSMIRLYEKIYRNNSFSEIHIDDYIRSLTTDIVTVFPQQNPVQLHFEIEPIVLPIDIVSSIGIIINELVTNSMKHAFSKTNAGVIMIRTTRQWAMIILEYSDNGYGVIDTDILLNPSNFGMNLVNILVKQLKGSMSIESGSGLSYSIRFPGNQGNV